MGKSVIGLRKEAVPDGGVQVAGNEWGGGLNITDGVANFSGVDVSGGVELTHWSAGFAAIAGLVVSE